MASFDGYRVMTNGRGGPFIPCSSDREGLESRPFMLGLYIDLTLLEMVFSPNSLYFFLSSLIFHFHSLRYQITSGLTKSYIAKQDHRTNPTLPDMMTDSRMPVSEYSYTGPVDEHDIELQVGTSRSHPSSSSHSALRRFSLALLLGLVGVTLLNLVGTGVHQIHRDWRGIHRFLRDPAYPVVEYVSGYVQMVCRSSSGPFLHITDIAARRRTFNPSFQNDH